MGDEHDGGPELARQGGQHLDDLVAVQRVERTGRLVGEQQPALADDGAGDGDALLLPTGEVVGVAVEMMAEAERVQRLDRRLPRLAGAAAVELERQHHVLDGGQRRHEVEPLEHVADVAPAQRRQILGGQVAEVPAVDAHLAGARRFEAAGEVEQASTCRNRTAPSRRATPRARPSG